ncbi:MAG: hypothetical protein Kow00106_19000 [Anaerolineae bacterium]
MIVFGTRIRAKVIDEGQFFCPHCQAQRLYWRKRATRYFALYFVPVFPLGQVGEFIECQTCHMAFAPATLERKVAPGKTKQPDNLAHMLNTLAERLAAGAPIEYLVRDLTAAGLERDLALELVNRHLADGQKHCSDCGLSYSAVVAVCALCGKPL